MSENQMLIFEKDYAIRRVWLADEEAWYFAVVDVIAAIINSRDPNNYWAKLKERTLKKSTVDLSTYCISLRLQHKSNRRMYQTDCANIQGIFRIIQEIPSPKVEPFKRWLAQTGEEKLEAESDPSKYIEMAMDAYRSRGYPEDWVRARVQKLISNEELAREWMERGVLEDEHGILVEMLKMETFGLTPDEHKAYKGLNEQDDLHDNMTRVELIFDMLGDETAIGVAQSQDTQGFEENKHSAKIGGKVAKRALQDFETQTGKQVLSKKKEQDLIEKKPPSSEKRLRD